MKFRFIAEVDGKVKAGYSGVMAKTGDVVNVPEKFIHKALTNPNYEKLAESTVTNVVKKKPGRPRKKKVKSGNKG